MQQRSAQYTERLGGVSERVLPHLEKMQPAEILDSARNLEQFDRVARRNFGVDNKPSAGGTLNVTILTHEAVVQVTT